MFRKMRKGKQLLPPGSSRAMINSGSHGVLACSGDGNYPYAVPLNYVYYKDKIYFHSAKAGHKIDAIAKNPKVSFSIIDDNKVVSEEYTTYFRSVTIFGKARIAEGSERLEAFKALAEKYSGDQPEGDRNKKINECTEAYIIAIDVEHISGKQAIEYVTGRA